MKKITILLLSFTIVVCGALPLAVHAAVVVSPLLIDKTVTAREMMKESVTITNDGSTPKRLFASVHEITLADGGAIKTFVPPSMSDGSISVTSWIAIDRGRIELAPGESTVIPLSFQISPGVVPGVYQAYIGFAHGTNRDEAEAAIMAGQGNGVIVRFSVAAETNELLRLLKFTVDRFVTTARDHSLTYVVSNPGDVALTPEGEVIIYNSRGEEVDALLLNPEQTTIAPGATVEFVAPLANTGLLGKYKAFLQLDYGDTQRATLYDTAFFYATPLWVLGALFVSILIVVGALLFLIRRAFAAPHHSDEASDVRMSVNTGTLRDNKDHDISLKNDPT